MLRNYSHPRIVSFLGVFKGSQTLLNRQKKPQKVVSLCFLMELADKSLGRCCFQHNKMEARIIEVPRQNSRDNASISRG